MIQKNPKANRGGYPSQAAARRGSRKHHHELTVRYLVVSEGELTEPQYFDTLKPIAEKQFGIQIVNRPGRKKNQRPTGTWKPNPEDVVKKCIEYRDQAEKKSREPGKDVLPYKRCFAVVDYDRWDEGSKPTPLDKAISLSKSEEICLIISYNKFEAWIVWHHEHAVPDTDTDRLSKQVEQLGYMDGKNLLPTFPLDKFDHASKRAKRNGKVPCWSKGSNPSTAMPVIFDALTTDKAKE